MVQVASPPRIAPLDKSDEGRGPVPLAPQLEHPHPQPFSRVLPRGEGSRNS